MAGSKVKTIMGTMEFARRLSLQDSIAMTNAFINLFGRSKITEIDSAYMYAGGKSEEFIGQMDIRLNDNVEIATKANPWDNKLLDAAGVRMQLETSLKRLKMDCVQLFYLHAPDHRTSIVETLEAVNNLYQAKKFKEFGLSNYASWQVAEICMICKNKGWIMPTVYQGMYSTMTRMVEKELFKCLRHFNMRFYAYSPLCGGMLTGKHKFEDADKNESGRFFGKGAGEMYRNRYWKKEMFESIEKIKQVLKEVYGNNVSIAEASLRWIYNHSQLDGAYGDGVVIGASSMDQFKNTISYIKKGPLDEKVVKVFDECWNVCSFLCADYMR